MIDDTLKRKIYADKIAEEIESYYSQKEDGYDENIVFAISGKWGEGKTELLNLLEPKLIEGGFTVIRFNPWKYSHEDISLKRAFLREIKKKLKSEVDLNDLYYDRNKTEIAWKNIIPFIKVVLAISFIVGFFIPVIFKYPLDIWWVNLATILKNFWGSGIGGMIMALLIIPLLIKTITISSRAAQVTTAEEFEDKFLELLSGKSKIVIFIDDLDRCTPKTVKIVLDSLRTFFRHSECSYVITGDHTVIEKYAAEELGTKDTEEGRRFLKKLFNVYWRLPLATPKVFNSFLENEIKKLGIGLEENQNRNIKNFLLDDGLFERNPRHVKRFIAALKFALESVKAQKEELSQINTASSNVDDTKEEETSIQEIIDNPDLLAKVLLIQEKFYPVYEKLTLYPSEIIDHEKSLRGEGKPEALTINKEKILKILGNDEALEKYVSLVKLKPHFTDDNNTTLFDPTPFFAFSGATGLPSLKGPDEANFSQYLKSGQLTEKLGSNLQVAPPEKRERFVQRALQIFNESKDEKEKMNIIGESLKMANLSDEWAVKLGEWKQKLFALPADQQNTLANDFWKAVLGKSPEVLSEVKTIKPEYLESLWPILEAIEERELHKDAKSNLENVLKESIGTEPLNLRGVKTYLEKFDSQALKEEIESKVNDPITGRKYLEHCQAIEAADSKLAKIISEKLRKFILDFSNINWTLHNRDFLKSIGLFENVKRSTVFWSEDLKKIGKVVSLRDQLELTDDEKAKIRNQTVGLVEKSADLQFVEDESIQSILDKESRIKIFEKLKAILADNSESLEKRKKTTSLLNKNNNLWAGLDINDVYNLLKEIKKLRLGRFADLKERPKEILESWGYEG